MIPLESSSPPPPVSSLRSRFEQIAAASSPSPARTTVASQPGLWAPTRMRSSSNVDPKPNLFMDNKRIVSGSGPADALNIPSLRHSPSFPDLKDSEPFNPSPPSRVTPPPQLPPDTNSVPTLAQLMPAKASSISRRPPPPPPPSMNKLITSPVDLNSNDISLTEKQTDGETTPSLGVASLRSKFRYVVSVDTCLALIML